MSSVLNKNRLCPTIIKLRQYALVSKTQNWKLKVKNFKNGTDEPKMKTFLKGRLFLKKTLS